MDRNFLEFPGTATVEADFSKLRLEYDIFRQNLSSSRLSVSYMLSSTKSCSRSRRRSDVVGPVVKKLGYATISLNIDNRNFEL